jgi:hypothetical protein
MLFTAIFTSFVLALPLVARSTPVVRSTPVTRDRLDDQINNLKVLDVIALGFEQFNFTSTLQDLAAGKTSQATTVLEALSLLAGESLLPRSRNNITLIFSPARCVERAEFVAGYRNAEIDFELIDILAAETKNSAVQILAVTAIGDMNVGNLGINNIVNSILAGQTPSPAE